MKAKKSFKRLSVLMVVMALMLCMLPMSALAQTSSGPTFDPSITSGSLTINKTNGAGTAIADTSLQYTVYKVADITQTNASGVVSVQYILGNGVTLTGGIVGNGTSVTVPTGVTAADFVSGLPTGTAVTNTGTTPGTLTFSSLPLGLYLVRETVTPAGVAQSNDFLVSIPMSTTVSGNSVWDYDPVATPKNTVVDGTVSKGITSGATLVSGSTYTASLGDSVTYAISAKLPTTFTITPYTTYTITDIPSTGLVIDYAGAGSAANFDGIVVSVGATTLTRGTHYTISASGTGFVVELITAQPTPTGSTTPGTQAAALTNGAVVTITYNAKLSPTATGSSFTNTVAVNSKYNSASGTVTPGTITPDPTNPVPTIMTYNYALQKVDSASAPLAGAKFAIQNSSGNYLAWTSTNGWTVATGLSDPNLYTFTSATASSAIVPFNGLAGGSYSIVEVSAPTGYSQLTAAIPVTISATTTADADTTGGGAGYSIQVVNSLANTFTLPGTGGMGIYLYTIGGVLLIGAAIVLFARNRKRKANNA